MAEASIPARLGRGLVRLIDALLRRAYGVYVFDDDPVCILRLSLIRSRRDLLLADGTPVQRGDPVAVIHFWNERLPPMPAEGADLRWARQMMAQLRPSLRLLAQYLDSQPALAAVPALCGEAAFIHAGNLPAGTSLLHRLGFELRPSVRTGAWGRFVRFWENLYNWMLVWTFNPGSLRGKRMRDLERYWLWMSRAALQRLYGGNGQTRRPAPAA